MAKTATLNTRAVTNVDVVAALAFSASSVSDLRRGYGEHRRAQRAGDLHDDGKDWEWRVAVMARF